jgi:hypothetical protein
MSPRCRAPKPSFEAAQQALNPQTNEGGSFLPLTRREVLAQSPTDKEVKPNDSNEWFFPLQN